MGIREPLPFDETPDLTARLIRDAALRRILAPGATSPQAAPEVSTDRALPTFGTVTSKPCVVTKVVVLHDVVALGPFRAAMVALNEASRRPSPFQTPQYLAAFEANSETASDGSRLMLLLAFAGEAVVGYLPLRRCVDPRLLGCGARIEFMTSRDADRPFVVSRPDDEAACALAFMQHLAEQQPCWGMLQFCEQDEQSALHLAARRVFGGKGYYVRTFPNNPNGSVILGEDGFDGWFRSLSSDQRSKTARRVRALFAADDIELVIAKDRRAVGELFDVYMDIEARSWKNAAHAGISRDPARIAFFKALLAPSQPALPTLQLLVREGLPLAGFLTLDYAGVSYGMEMCFDEADQALAPGNVLMLLTIREAAARGAKAFNMLGNFAYHKSRWKAQITETAAVQVFPHGSRAHLKTIVGRARRRMFGAPKTQRDVEHNLTREVPVPGSIMRKALASFGRSASCAVPDTGGPSEGGDAASPVPTKQPANPVVLTRSRECFAGAMKRIELTGATVERWAGAALADRLPFSVPGLRINAKPVRKGKSAPSSLAAASATL